MNVKKSYNLWAEQYDTNENKTRDLEAISLKTTLANFTFNNCLEIGCGTGKNTEWLISKAKHITAIDLSDEMLLKAKEKIDSNNVHFQQADITMEWTFAENKYDLITFSLVLEHIENLEDIFRKASKVLSSNGHLYVGELHPFKQYSGSKARFDADGEQHIVTCFTHNISDFTNAAKKNGMELISLEEFFDENNRTTVPRILTMLFKNKEK
jgi:ubiquinone/menaquinone biosynthesis C-methylase UbiE